jgi:signal transduction histidine kinase
VHAGEVMESASPGLIEAAQGAAPRRSWPGSLMERAVALLLADYRRPPGPIAAAAVLALIAVLARDPAAGPLSPGLATILGVLATAPIAVIRRFPAAAIGVILTASAVFVAFGRLSWSVAAVAGWLIALAACPVMLPRRPAVLAVMLTEGAVLLATFGLGGNATPWDATAAEALAVIAAWGAGEMVRARRRSALDQAAAAEQLRYLGERDAVARERASIARELHDVVAHHVSMIAVRAATAPYAISGLPPPGEAAFGEIADEARTALAELRVVLGVLRTPGRGSESAPQPRLADLEGLMGRMRSAGTDVAMTVSGEPRPLPASVELCCYRIVQEALTNAGRHAPGSRVRVDLCYRQASLSVRVSNGRSGYPLPGPGEPAAAGRSWTGQGQPVIGYGLTGLRERVEMLRGQFRAGPDEQGGFGVAAVLPESSGALEGSGVPEGAGALEDSAAPEGAGTLDGIEGGRE